jgi:anti-sigma regulatory factor (Ser/Thr protein kinase)
MAESIRIAIEDSSQTAEARRVARKLADQAGLNSLQAERVAIVVTEACTNLIKHAGRGEVILNAAADGSQALAGLELLVLDRGPGMANLDQCLRDGFSTGGSQGNGLGAIIRLSTSVDFYTAPQKGTVLMARWFTAKPNPVRADGRGPLQVGVVNVCKPGQEVCGDSWGVEQTAERVVAVLADGLGHGLEARMASVEAVRMLRLNAHLSPIPLVECIHQALRHSRGAAVAVAQIDRTRGEVTFAGVGNIAARIYADGVAGQHLVSVNGTAGLQMHRLNQFSYPWPDNGMLVLHSDGLTTQAGLDRHPGVALRDASVIAGVLYRDFNRGHDDSTVLVAKAA